MNSQCRSIDAKLRKTAGRWKTLRLLQHTATLGALVSLCALALGFGVLADWITRKDVFLVLCVALAAAAASTWLMIALRLLAETCDRPWLAGKIESANPELLDRLNTLAFLEQAKVEPMPQSFLVRIARQTQHVFSRKPPRSPFSTARSLVHLLIFGVMLASALFVYHHYAPWERLLAAEEQRKAQAKNNKEAPPLPEPTAVENDLVETNQAWGEVRITEPGRDLQATPADVISLQIEAAANQPLEKVLWRSAINDAAEQVHELPAPAEPRFAAYRPEIEIEKLGLEPWDVLTYFAKADTVSSNSYSSEVYFVEVRPFQEDLQKVPGSGSGGSCYGFLKRLTEFIQRQQHIIRETHQHVQRPQTPSDTRIQDRDKLADAESDLRDSVKHLSAEMTAALGPERIGGVLDDLSLAEGSLLQAGGSLRFNLMPEAQRQEREALQRLVATRKHFQKVISEHPDEFGEEPPAEDPPQTDDATAKDKLKDIAEFKNEAKAAQEFLEQAVQQQQGIARRAGLPAADPQLAQQEKALQDSLHDFKNQHPQITRGAEREFKEAETSLAHAAESLEKRRRDARNRTQQGVEKLQELSEAVQKEIATQQLADAYKLKQMLDRQIRSLGRCQQSPGDFSGSQLQQLADSAKGTVEQLKNLAEQPPTRDAFDQTLRDALSDRNKELLDTQLSRLASAEGEEPRKDAAGQAKAGLENVRQAFEDSLPEYLQAAAKNDPLKPNSSDSFQRGLSQLERLIEQQESGQSGQTEDQAKQGREALANLRNGLDDTEGGNERTVRLLARLEEEFKKQNPDSDVGDLRKLFDELLKFSLESSTKLAAQAEKPSVSNIDPGRLPPAYRSRIEKYFQRLSER